MNYKILPVFLTLFSFSTVLNAVTIQRIYLSGQLDDNGLLVNADYNNSMVSGYFEIDLDEWSSTSFGSDTRYFMTDWDISITPTSGSTLYQRSSSENLDSGSIILDRSADQILIFNNEDIDNPATASQEDRSLSMVFNTSYDILFQTTFEELLAGDLNAGTASTFSSGNLQFSTSQFPTSLTTGSFTTVAPVPLPGAVWLFSSGMLALVGLSRRRNK